MRQALNRGAAHLQRNEFAPAIRELKRAVALEPKSAPAHMLLGQAYLMQGSYEMLGEAQAELVQALELDPKLAWARFYLGKIYLELGRTGKARQELEAALRIKPDVPHFLSLLGEVNRKLGNLSLAVEQNRRALEIDPSMNAAHYYLGLAYLDLKREDEALRELEKAVESPYIIPEMYLAPGTIHAAKGDLEKAAALFKKAIALTPSRPEGHLRLAQIYRRQKSLDLALEELGRAFPEGARLFNTVYFQQLQAEVHFETGRVYQDKGAFGLAVAAYEQALMLAPEDGRIHRQLAEVLYARGDHERAREHAQKAAQLEKQFR